MLKSGKVERKHIKLTLTTVHLKCLDRAGELLGHGSRSETLRWLAFNSPRFAKEAIEADPGDPDSEDCPF